MATPPDSLRGADFTFTGEWAQTLRRQAHWGVVNVKDWGAYGDGVHDDTAAIQAALNEIGRAGGGTVFFPDGTYLVNGPFVTTNGYSTLLALPYQAWTSVTEGPNPISITLLGSTFPAMQPSEGSPLPPTNSGAIILSTLTEGMTNGSILGGPNITSGRTVIIVNIRNLTIRQGYPTVMHGLDLSGVEGCDVANVMVDVSVAPTDAKTPAAKEWTGIYLPSSAISSNYGHVSLKDFYVQSYSYGINTGSHAHIDDGVIQYCHSSIAISNGNHPIYIGHVNSEQAVYDITASTTNAAPHMVVQLLDIETQEGAGARIYDPDNYLRGKIIFDWVVTNAGQSGPLSMEGGANIEAFNLADMGFRDITPPASPLISGTVYQNTLGTSITLYQPAYATTSGTAGSVAVALGSSSSPSTLYTDLIDAGATSGSPRTLILRVPPGWYYSFTASGATLATAQIQGE